MIVSVHIADLGRRGTLGALRGTPDAAGTPGLRYAETAIAAPLRGDSSVSPRGSRAALIAAWDGEDALADFEAEHPVGAGFAGGWQVRMEPLRVFGAWPELPGLPERELPVSDEEPVVVLTLGHLRLRRALPFLRASGRAERALREEAGLLAATGLAHPPHLVSTFSVWRSAREMREYAYREQGSHRAAVGADRARPFHHRSAFIRFRPRLSRGSWEGRDPLRGLLRPAPV
jgi:hypothetical protein